MSHLPPEQAPLARQQSNAKENNLDATASLSPPQFKLEASPAAPNAVVQQKEDASQSQGANWTSQLDSGTVTDSGVLAGIEAARGSVADHGQGGSKKLKTAKYNGKSGHMYVGDKKGEVDPSNIGKGNSIKDRIDGVVWKELGGEGTSSSINTYDSEIFTWGRGFSGKNQLKEVLDVLLNANPSIKAMFNAVGITLDGKRNIRVVDTATGNIASGNDALHLIKNDTRLMSFFIEMGENEDTKQASVDAQWEVIKKRSGKVPDFVYDEKANAYKDGWNDASVAMSVHMAHWMAIGAWQYNREMFVQSGGNALKIVQAFSHGLVPKTKAVNKQPNGALLWSNGFKPIDHFKHMSHGTGFSAIASANSGPFAISDQAAASDPKYSNSILMPTGKGTFYVIPQFGAAGGVTAGPQPKEEQQPQEQNSGGMGILGGSVGKGGVNNEDDVMIIQTYMVQAGYLPLYTADGASNIDGKIGNNTIMAIEAFQQTMFGSHDGVISPGKSTIKKLAELYGTASPNEEFMSSPDDLMSMPPEEQLMSPIDGGGSSPVSSSPVTSTPATPAPVAAPKQGDGLTSAVGADKENLREDVRAVQVLLNQAGAKLDPDGYFGTQTLGAITAYQQKAFNWSDGVIDPGGRSWRSLKEGKVKIPPQEQESKEEPIEQEPTTPVEAPKPSDSGSSSGESATGGETATGGENTTHETPTPVFDGSMNLDGLTGSVGKNGDNHPADVAAVQTLMNKIGAKLKVTGRADTAVEAAIYLFQRKGMGLYPPDCRIDAGGGTWKKLVAGKWNFNSIDSFETADEDLSQTTRPRESDVEKVYGQPGDWSNTTTVSLPFTLYYGDQAMNTLKIHKKVAASLTAALQGVLNHYGIEEIKRLRIDRNYAGTLNKRKKRGGDTWSMHAYGIAIDLNWAENQLAWGADKAIFAKKEYEPLLRIMEQNGWYNLGRYKNYDYMHFQAATPF